MLALDRHQAGCTRIYVWALIQTGVYQAISTENKKALVLLTHSCLLAIWWPLRSLPSPRLAGIFTDKVNPYSFFHRNSVNWRNCVGCILSVNISPTLVSILFGTAIPTTKACSYNFFILVIILCNAVTCPTYKTSQIHMPERVHCPTLTYSLDLSSHSLWGGSHSKYMIWCWKKPGRLSGSTVKLKSISWPGKVAPIEMTNFKALLFKHHSVPQSNVDHVH